MCRAGAAVNGQDKQAWTPKQTDSKIRAFQLQHYRHVSNVISVITF